MSRPLPSNIARITVTIALCAISAAHVDAAEPAPKETTADAGELPLAQSAELRDLLNRIEEQQTALKEAFAAHLRDTRTLAHSQTQQRESLEKQMELCRDLCKNTKSEETLKLMQGQYETTVEFYQSTLDRQAETYEKLVRANSDSCRRAMETFRLVCCLIFGVFGLLGGVLGGAFVWFTRKGVQKVGQVNTKAKITWRKTKKLLPKLTEAESRIGRMEDDSKAIQSQLDTQTEGAKAYFETLENDLFQLRQCARLLSRDPQEQRLALDILGEKLDKRTIPALMDCLADKTCKPDVAVAILEALAKFPRQYFGQRAEKVLNDVSEQRTKRVKDAAKFTIKALFPTAPEDG